MIKKTFFYFSVLLACCLLFNACKKKTPTDEIQISNTSLTGYWEETSIQFKRKIMFGTDGKFIMQMGENSNYYILIKGNYTSKNNNLSIKAVEQLTKDGEKEIISTELNSELFEAATYSISGDELTINYISYPADAPVKTEAKFKKLLPPG